MNVTADRLPSCQLDVDTCPIGWVRRGVRCMAEGRNEGVSFSRRGALVSFAFALFQTLGSFRPGACADELSFFTL